MSTILCQNRKRYIFCNFQFGFQKGLSKDAIRKLYKNLLTDINENNKHFAFSLIQKQYFTFRISKCY